MDRSQQKCRKDKQIVTQKPKLICKLHTITYIVSLNVKQSVYAIVNLYKYQIVRSLQNSSYHKDSLQRHRKFQILCHISSISFSTCYSTTSYKYLYRFHQCGIFQQLSKIYDNSLNLSLLVTKNFLVVTYYMRPLLGYCYPFVMENKMIPLADTLGLVLSVGLLTTIYSQQVQDYNNST